MQSQEAVQSPSCKLVAVKVQAFVGSAESRDADAAHCHKLGFDHNQHQSSVMPFTSRSHPPQCLAHVHCALLRGAVLKDPVQGLQGASTTHFTAYPTQTQNSALTSSLSTLQCTKHALVCVGTVDSLPRPHKLHQLGQEGREIPNRRSAFVLFDDDGAITCSYMIRTYISRPGSTTVMAARYVQPWHWLLPRCGLVATPRVAVSIGRLSRSP